LLWGKGVYQGNPTPGKSSVHIFSQEYATVLFCGYCENQRIPDLEFMIHIQGSLGGRSCLIAFVVALTTAPDFYPF
jgi:hypothetical protein